MAVLRVLHAMTSARADLHASADLLSPRSLEMRADARIPDGLQVQSRYNSVILGAATRAIRGQSARLRTRLA